LNIAYNSARQFAITVIAALGYQASTEKHYYFVIKRCAFSNSH